MLFSVILLRQITVISPHALQNKMAAPMNAETVNQSFQKDVAEILCHRSLLQIRQNIGVQLALRVRAEKNMAGTTHRMSNADSNKADLVLVDSCSR